LHVAGALVGHPINVVKAKTVDLLCRPRPSRHRGFIDTESWSRRRRSAEPRHVNLQESNASWTVTAITRGRRHPDLDISQVTPSESSLIKLIGMEPRSSNFLRNTLGIKASRKSRCTTADQHPQGDRHRLRARHATTR